ncbi:MAG TPA: phosphodiester glycosidase family protein [Solirubrobacteraceae bacterium]|nr:phosphodiester glycosidase family protein [Solirubrobacteraceae bacterium]
MQDDGDPARTFSLGAGPLTPQRAGAVNDAVPVHDIALRRARRRQLPPRLTPARRVRRILAIGLCLCFVPISISYLSAITGPSNSSFTINSFEWLRDNGAAGLAVQAEDIYYSLNAPSTGGPGIHKLAIKHAGLIASVHPRNIAPVLTPPLRGEGAWVPSETWTGANAPVQITQFRSDPSYPSMVAGVAWIDTARTWISLNPGRLEPNVTLPRGPMEVPPASRGRLLATFNSAFKLQDSGGGFAVNGNTYAPMKNGMATLIGYTNGHVDIEAWQWGPKVPAGVQFARQNLPLVVENGQPNPNLSDGPAWGVTVGNAIRVWRSGVGVDKNGNVIYAAADNQTVRSLAQILIRAGAVRAMQFDINSYWVSFITYAHPYAGSPSNLLPDMTRSVDRYLSPDDRDFFAVYAR